MIAMPLAEEKRFSIGTRIRDLRKRLGMTQEALAEALGISQVQISQYERGRTNPNLQNVYRLCEILKVTPNDILGF